MRSCAKETRWLDPSLGLVLGCLLFTGFSSEAQNLVPNPSFEENTACPVTIGFQGFSKPLHWEKWNESPEYFHACAGSLGGIDTLIGVPQNGVGFQYAMDGEAYVGMIAYGTSGGGGSFREYVGSELIEPLTIGQSYYLSFWANVAGGLGLGGSNWARNHACNNMGMLFTMEPNIWTGNNGPLFALRNYAHLHSDAIIDDLDAWIQVSGWFTADSAYRYLVLGNFFSNELTEAYHLAPELPWNSGGAYYFVDQVCVALAPEHCDWSQSIDIRGYSRSLFYPNPAITELNIEYEGKNGEWHVYDLMGKHVASGILENGVTKIPVLHWSSGQYMLTVRIEGKTSRSSFVVMH